MTKKISTCKICSKKFEYYTTNRSGIYCSRKCMFQDENYNKKRIHINYHHSKDTKEKISNSLKKQKVIKQCINCKENFECLNFEENKRIFCSTSCSNMYNFKGKYGELSSQWRGGLSFGLYGTEFNDELKEKIRKRDNYTCQFCGITQENENRKLDTHHIDYNKENNNEYNLVSLCRYCHMSTNFNREKWTKYFKEYKLNKLKEKYGKISIQICTKDRATELALLLQSIRTQSYNLTNILILDESEHSQVMQFYFIQYMIQRLKLEGHDIKVIKNGVPAGVSMARQQLVDYYMENCKEELIVRIDDDSICDSFMLEKLVEGINNGYDIVGCIVPPFVSPDNKRNIKYVEPIIGECRLNNVGELILNLDDCGYKYNEEKILPSHHFRSSCIIKREVFEKINYKSRLSKNGFREEQILSFKAILAGFKIGIHTGAICWHLQTPSGGEKPTMNMVPFNQKIFEETTKQMFEDNGDFIHKYNIDNNLKEKEYTEEELIKSTNLVTRK